MSSFGLEILDRAECAALLESHSVGRIAVWSGEHPAVLPILYAMLDGDVVFRTAPGEKLIAAVLGQEVCFEIDGAEPARHTGWSVNVVGLLEEIVNHEEREHAEGLGLVPWAGDFRDRYVRLRSTQITGRRITQAAPGPVGP